jgi:hypothetical protein
MLDLAEYGRTAGVKKLAQEYLGTVGNRYNEADVLAADFGPNVSVRRAADGKLVAKLPDGEMLLSQAVATGKIALRDSGSPPHGVRTATLADAYGGPGLEIGKLGCEIENSTESRLAPGMNAIGPAA